MLGGAHSSHHGHKSTSQTYDNQENKIEEEDNNNNVDYKETNDWTPDHDSHKEEYTDGEMEDSKYDTEPHSKEKTQSDPSHYSSPSYNENHYEEDPASEAPPSSLAHSSLSCRFHYRSNALPKGRTKVSHLEFIGTTHSYKECADLCCQHGPKCQIGWLVNKKCYAVGCHSYDKDKCHIVPSPYDARYTSSVVVMSFNRKPSHSGFNNDESSSSSSSSILMPRPSSSSSLSFSSSLSSSSPKLRSLSVTASVNTRRSSSSLVAMVTTSSSSAIVVKATPNPKPSNGKHKLINNGKGMSE